MKLKKAIMHWGLALGIFGLTICANKAANDFSGIITQYLCGFGLNTGSKEYGEALEAGAKMAVGLEEDGVTLLKNQNAALPLSASENKINVFGWSGCDNGFIYQGGGSGEGSRQGAVSLYQGLRNSGLEINEDLASAYNNLSLRRSGYTEDVTQYYRLYEPDSSFYTASLINQAKSFSNVAVVVLGRRGAEGTDLPKVQYDENGNADNTRKYSSISAKEEKMLDIVTQNFEKVIVVMNTANPMECGFLNDEGIDAGMIMYMPGNHGSNAIGTILTGNVTPSGHTVDTFAYDLATAPSYANAGSDGVHWPEGQGSRFCDYQNYSENIYTGYYWYETADKDGFFNNVTNDYGTGYDGVVQYPFGYGLSYTNFDWTLKDVSIPEGSNLNADDEIKFDVIVKNVGSTFGKDVVELYYDLPYTVGGIEKPALKLGAFAKTDTLEPGEVQELALSVKVSDMASYDCYDKNNNGFMGYELEKGDYNFSLRTDAHDVKKMTSEFDDGIYNYHIENGYKYENDPVTGNKVENRFTNFTNDVSGATSTRVERAMSDESKAYSVDGLDCNLNVTYMTRENFKDTFPVFADTVKMSDQFKKETWYVNAPKVNPDDQMPITGSKATNYTIQDVAGLDISDPKWEALVSQLDVETLGTLCSKGGFGTIAIDSIGKPHTVDLDGPSGFNAVVTGSETGFAINYPCETVIASTWNWKLAYQWGLSIGNEASIAGIDGWYAPGANTHRSALGGRNFEYWSEDAVLGGTMCSYTILGAKEKGVYSYIKHFVANDSDTGRNGEFKFLTEQALREIYCKPFEIAVKEGGANAMMISVDRVGTVRCTGSSALLQDVLRDEWGFEGSCISDYYQGGNVNDIDEGIRAGNDLMLNPNGSMDTYDDTESATAIIAMKKSAKNILYTYAETKYYAANASGLDLGSIVGTQGNVNEWWKPVLYTVEAVVYTGMIAYAAIVLLKYLNRFPTKRRKQ